MRSTATGFLALQRPGRGYREYGVDQLGLDGPDRARRRRRHPHASFLALRYAPEDALRNLANLEAEFDCWADGGFLDAIAVRSGRVSRRYLALDQGMVMASLGNALANDSPRRYVSAGSFASVLRPLMQQEVFASRAEN